MADKDFCFKIWVKWYWTLIEPHGNTQMADEQKRTKLQFFFKWCMKFSDLQELEIEERAKDK